MTENTSNKPPIWFWIASTIGLIWNGMGISHYLGQAYNTDGWRSQYTAEQLEVVSNYPSWLTAAFAIAVFAGTLGCILLLLRKKFANFMLLISLIAVIIQMGYLLSQGHTDNMVMTIMIILFSVLLVLFSRKAVSSKWLT